MDRQRVPHRVNGHGYRNQLPPRVVAPSMENGRNVHSYSAPNTYAQNVNERHRGVDKSYPNVNERMWLRDKLAKSSSGEENTSSSEGGTTSRRCRHPISVSDAAKFNKIACVSSSSNQDSARIFVNDNATRRRGNVYEASIVGGPFERRDLGSAGSRTSVSSRDSSGSLSRKERRDAVKARVEALRERYCDSSSDEDDSGANSGKLLPRYRSDETLNKKSRVARTERLRNRVSTDADWLERQMHSGNGREVASEGSEYIIGGLPVDEPFASNLSPNSPPYPRYNAHVTYDDAHQSDLVATKEDGEPTNWMFISRGSPNEPTSPRKKDRFYDGSDSGNSKQSSRVPTPPPRTSQARLAVIQPLGGAKEVQKRKLFGAAQLPPKSPPIRSNPPSPGRPVEMHGPQIGTQVYYYTDVAPKQALANPPFSARSCSPNAQQPRYEKKFLPNKVCRPEVSVPTVTGNLLLKKRSSPMPSGDVKSRLTLRRASDVSVRRSVTDFWKQKDAEAMKKTVPPSAQVASGPTVAAKNSEVVPNVDALWCYNSVYKSTDDVNVEHNVRRSNSETVIPRCGARISADVMSSSDSEQPPPLPNQPPPLPPKIGKLSGCADSKRNGQPPELLRMMSMPEKTDTDPDPDRPERRRNRFGRGRISSLENAENLLEELILRHKRKIKSEHLSDAVGELEEMYERLDLGDEDLMDRAERRDFLTRLNHLKKDRSETENDLEETNCRARDPERDVNIGLPDAVNDDVAYRKTTRTSPKRDETTRTTMSYLLCSPAHTQPAEMNDSHLRLLSVTGIEPDVVKDDVSYRKFALANKMDPEVMKQRRFGIPKGPISSASRSNYVKITTPKHDEMRPTFGYKTNPDPIRDDMAFRNLRKDPSVYKPKVDFDELDRILRGETLSKKCPQSENMAAFNNSRRSCSQSRLDNGSSTSSSVVVKTARSIDNKILKGTRVLRRASQPEFGRKQTTVERRIGSPEKLDGQDRRSRFRRDSEIPIVQNVPKQRQRRDVEKKLHSLETESSSSSMMVMNQSNGIEDVAKETSQIVRTHDGQSGAVIRKFDVSKKQSSEVVNKPVPSSVTKSRPIQLFSVTEDLPPKRKFTEVNPIFCPPSEIRKETVDTSGIDSRFPAAPSVPKRSSLDESDVEVLGSKTGDRSPEAIPVRWKSRSISSDANRRNEFKQFDEVDHVAPSTDTKPQLVSKLVQMAEQKMENFKPDRRNEEFSAQDVVHGRKFTKSPVPEVAVVVVVVHDPKIPSEAVGSETTATEIDSRLSSGPAEPVCVEPVVVREPEIKRVAKHEIVVKRTPEKMFVDDGGSTSESNQARVAVSRVRPISSISNASVCRQRKDVTVPDVETGVQSELTRPKSSIRADRDVDEFKRQIARQKILKLCRGSLWTSQPEFGSRLEPREDDAKEVADSTESSQDATITDDVAEVESHVRQIDATDDDGSEAQKVSTIWHWPLWADSPKSDDDRNSVKPPPVVVAQRPATRKKMSQIRRGGPLWSSQPEMDSSPEVPESKREPNDICDRSLPVPEQSTQSNALNEPVVELPVSDEETPTAPLNYSVAQKAKMFVSQQSVERHVSTNQRVDTSTSHLHIKPVRTAENVMEAKTGSDEEDKLSGMSLADKIKLFKKKTEEQNLVPTAPARRRRQGDPSRFRTQPVTTEEVENATGEVSSNLMVPSVKVQKSVSMMIANELMAKRKSQPTSGADQTKPNNSNVCRNTEDDRRVKTLEVPSSNKDSTKDDNSGLSSDDEVQSYLRIDVKPSDASKIPTPFKLAENGELKKSKQRNDAGDSQKMNPAVVRRLQANQRRTDHKRIVETNNNKNVSMMTNDSPCIIESTPGLKQRLASLQKSQEDGWKERLRTIKTDDPEKEIKSCSKDLKSETSINDGSSNLKKPEIVKHREQNLTPKSRPVSIADRLNLLESSRKDWRKRVEKSDAEQYTVAGKMGLSPADSPVTPVSQRKFQVPELQIFRSNTDDINRLKSIGATTLFPISPVKPKSSEITKSKSTNDAANKQHDSSDSDDDPSNVFSTPKLFTPSVNVTSSINESSRIDDDSFSSFLIQTSKSSDKLHVQHRKVRAQRKQATSGNPIKKLASRTDLSFAYKEENNNRSNMAESPTKRIKQETSSKKSSMATSALAGLASSEEFAAVSLRKVQDGDSCANTTHNLCPYKDKMLLQIKGRRVIQTRLVEPKYSSINSGDCFILITPDVTFSYVGSLANVIEKSKAADISAVIKTQKDMGYKNSNQEVIILDEDNASAYSKSDVDNFWHLLDHSVVDGCKPAEAGPPSEDETYEASMISTNKVYRVDDVSLVPCEEFWGSSLNYEMLKPEEIISSSISTGVWNMILSIKLKCGAKIRYLKVAVFVFDFGTELYVWQGKLSATNQRRISVQLAKELWNQGYDYSSCEFNPIYPMSNSKPKCDEERPNWALLAKINQHMETVLFKEKFFNWPNEDLTNKSKRSDSDSDSSDSSSGRSADLCPCDVNEMLNSPVPGVDMVLEMSHLGRGIEYHDENERRHYEIETRSIKVWHVQEHGTNEVSGSSYGHFYSSDTYVIRWFYTVVQTGRSLSGGASKHSKVGRDRCVYFFWQGRDSSINEKGASALMTVELDKEKGPHMRVIQGKEPPCFLNLFKGNMMVHRGRRLEKGSHSKGDWRLYIVLGEEATETTLIEVQCHVSSLRSRGIFILVNASTSSLYVWYGSKIDKSQRTVARKAIDHLKTKKPSEVGFKRSSTTLIVNRESEGDESDQFLSALHSSDRKLYHSLSSDDRTFDYTMRAFRLTSVSGTFSSIELLCPFRVNNKPCAFPIVQADLYKVTQPALFLIDNRTEAYLWQGWFPKNNTIPRNRWNEEKRCAMQTTIDYCNLKGIDRKNALLVTAGSEPLVFKNLFPEWFDDWIEDLHELDRTDSSRPQRIYDLLNNLKKDNYTFEELKQHPPPQGVNPKRLEAYLAVDEFQKIFDMTKEEFYEKPSWKQLELRKAADLF